MTIHSSGSVVLLVFATIGSGAQAADPVGQPAAATAKDQAASFFRIDMQSPTAPAFAMLGLSPEKVLRPTSPHDLGMGLLSGFDPRGNFQTGLAMDTVPYLLLAGHRLSLADYRKSAATRVLGRTALSLATAKGIDDDRALRAAIGFQTVFFDRGDPRMDTTLQADFDREAKSAFESLKLSVVRGLEAVVTAQAVDLPFQVVDREVRDGTLPPGDVARIEGRRKELATQSADAILKQTTARLGSAMPTATSEAYALISGSLVDALSIGHLDAKPGQKLWERLWDLLQTQLRYNSFSGNAADYSKAVHTAFEPYRAASRRRNWNRSNWMLGGAWSMVATDGSLNKVKDNGIGLWTTAAYGFEGVPGLRDDAQVLLHFRYRSKEFVPDPADKTKAVVQDNNLVAARFVYGSERANFGAEWGAYRDKLVGGSWDAYQTYGGVLELRMGEAQWLNLSLSTTAGKRGGESTSLLAGFHWGLASGPQLQVKPQ